MVFARARWSVGYKGPGLHQLTGANWASHHCRNVGLMGKTEQISAGSTSMDVVPAWAQALFCPPLQSQGQLPIQTPCAAVAGELAHQADVLAGCAGAAARRAGEYPELLTERMAWCLKQTAQASAVSLCDDWQTA